MNKPPIWNQTFTLIGRLAAHYSFGSIAGWCGVEMQTAEAWGREPESDTNPSGSGKANPQDCVKRLIGKAFAKEPGLAREMADVYTAYVDFLEHSAGREFIQNGGNLLELLAHSAQEHSDILVKLVDQHASTDDVYREFVQFQAVMNQFGAALAQKRFPQSGKRAARCNGNGVLPDYVKAEAKSRRKVS